MEKSAAHRVQRKRLLHRWCKKEGMLSRICLWKGAAQRILEKWDAARKTCAENKADWNAQGKGIVARIMHCTRTAVQII